MDNLSEIEKALPAKEVNGSPGRQPENPKKPGLPKSRESKRTTDDNPVHAGWVTGGRGIKKVINEELLAGVSAPHESDLLQDREVDPHYAHDPHPNPLPARERE